MGRREWDRSLRPGCARCQPVAFSPDEGYLAFRQGGTVSLLDLTDARVRPLLGHSDIIASLSFHPNGQILATGGINEDQTVQLWDLNAGQLVTKFEGDPGYPMQDITFSPDGRTLAGGGMNGVILRDVETGETRRLKGHAEAVLSVTFSPDGNLLISGDQRDEIRGWSVETGELLETIEGRGYSMALSPDGRLLAFKETLDDIVLWEVHAGREVHRWPASQPIAFSPGGQLLALGSPDASSLCGG